MGHHAPEQLTLTIRDLLAPLRARLWLIVLVVAVVTGGAYFHYARQKSVYTASTKLFVGHPGNPLVGVGAGYSDDRTVANEAALITSEGVAGAAAKRLNYRAPPPGLLAAIAATPAAGSDFITIRAQAASSVQAARVANAFAQGFIEVQAANQSNAVSQALAQLRQQLKQLPNTPANAVARSNAIANIQQLKEAAATGAGNPTQIDLATPPASSSSRPAWEKALAAAFVALLGCSMLAYLLQRLDPRLKSIEDASQIYHAPILGSVLHDSGIEAFADQLPALSPRSKEAFRQLRVNLELTALDRPFRTILITSATAGEGKSTVARNLALALHEAGRSVALVDADLRNPALHRMLKVDAGPGFTSVLARDATLDDVTRGVQVESLGLAALGRMTDGASNGTGRMGNTITFVSAGPTPPNPPAVLESAAAGSLLEDIAAQHDIVIVDTAPITAVSDTIPLLGRVDAVLIAARSGVTDRRSARLAASAIARVHGATLAGVVVNDLAAGEFATYGGRYGYGYGDGDGEAKLPSRSAEPAPAGPG
jgi:receptor protein-tyrosine kinase